MKKFTLSLVTILLAICMSINAQVIVDYGIDWDASKHQAVFSINQWTDITAFTQTLNKGTDSEVQITYAGAGIRNRTGGKLGNELYEKDITTPYFYWELCSSSVIPGEQDYMEYSITENSAKNVIVQMKINGSAGEAGLDKIAVPVVLFSDRAPFDENRIIGFYGNPGDLTLPATKDSEGVLVSDYFGTDGIIYTAPAGCKSYRVLKVAALEQTSLDPILYAVSEWGDISLGQSDIRKRIGYVSGTLVEGSTGIETIHTNGKTVVSEKFYDVTGRKVSEDFKGLVIVKSIYEDGSSSSMKQLNR